DREAHRTAEIIGATGPAHDVAKRPRGDDRSIPVRCRKPMDQLAGDFLLRAQDAVALERPGRDASGVCSHEGGRDGLDRAGAARGCRSRRLLGAAAPASTSGGTPRPRRACVYCNPPRGYSPQAEAKRRNRAGQMSLLRRTESAMWAVGKEEP